MPCDGLGSTLEGMKLSASPAARANTAAPMNSIVVDGLSKRYGPNTVVDEVSFSVRPGVVTGFLGPNGSGKSTTMRMMVGLTPPSGGQATVLGVPYRQLANPGRHVGVLLDASAQHSGRTGREVLTLGAMVMGLERGRVDRMLTTVGLTPAESRQRTGTYSLGMRQRLGVAHALLGEPQVLILDEPANGLDPAGIHWMRGLLRDFAAAGGAVLLSSHLLREIEIIADELVIIGRGRIVARGAKEDILTAGGVYVRSAADAALVAALNTAGIAFTPTADGGYLAQTDTESIARAATAGGAILTELRPSGTDGLEQMFLSLTADDARIETRR